jgi:hypothetical protein
MYYVGNADLKRTLKKMLDNLLASESIGPLEFRLIKGEYFLGNTWIAGKRHRIVINHRIGRMIKTKRGLARAYAVLAHEIGHVLHVKGLSEKPVKDKDFTTEFRVSAEKEADRHAIRLLAKIYPNPKEIILEQIAYAHRISLRHAKEKNNIELANIFAYGRKNALTTDTAVDAAQGRSYGM